MTRPVVVFYRVGRVERGPRYTWRDGYSRRPDGGEQPWRTRDEARAEARADGARAVFREVPPCGAGGEQ